jgi:hypothetical protein
MEGTFSSSNNGQTTCDEHNNLVFFRCVFLIVTKHVWRGRSKHKILNYMSIDTCFMQVLHLYTREVHFQILKWPTVWKVRAPHTCVFPSVSTLNNGLPWLILFVSRESPSGTGGCRLPPSRVKVQQQPNIIQIVDITCRRFLFIWNTKALSHLAEIKTGSTRFCELIGAYLYLANQV